MIAVVKVGGYDKGGIKRSLATPRASKSANVYGLSVDVFVFWIKRLTKTRFLTFLFSICAFSILAHLFQSLAQSEPDEARALVATAEQVMRGDTNRMKLEMQVVSPTWTRSYTLDSWMKDRDKTLIRILEPVKQRGESYLKLGFQLRIYIPKVERTMVIPPSSMLQPFLGSDFSYDDLVRASRWDEDYEQKIVGEETIEGHEAVVIDLLPKPKAAVVYGHLKLWLRKEDAIPLKEEFFDEHGNLLKAMWFKEIQPMGGHTIPTRWEMINYAKGGRRTLIRVLEAEYDLPLDAGLFTEKQLGQSVRR